MTDPVERPRASVIAGTGRHITRGKRTDLGMFGCQTAAEAITLRDERIAANQRVIEPRSARRYGLSVDSSWITVGAVFRLPHDERPDRVLVHADGVVMYDYWLPHRDAWNMADLAEVRRKTVTYYLTTSSGLSAKADHLRNEPLTAEEAALHRPDLPFAAVQQDGLDWPSSEARVTTFAAEFQPDIVALDTPEIYLSPFGAKGGSQRHVRIDADDKARFTARELMRKAAELQAPRLGPRPVVDGVGIYRSGLHRGRPSFYLWGAVSRLETHLAAFARSQTNDTNEAEERD
jgi:hypothetical protein